VPERVSRKNPCRPLGGFFYTPTALPGRRVLGEPATTQKGVGSGVHQPPKKPPREKHTPPTKGGGKPLKKTVPGVEKASNRLKP